MTATRTISPRKTLTLVKGKRRQKTAADAMLVANGATHDVVVEKNSEVLPNGAHTVDSDGARHAGFVGISPGNAATVDYYAGQIDQNWQCGVKAFMTTARLCAEANAELTPKGKRKLIKQLPFEASMFSKFAQIGNDHRLNKPELRRLLPPYCTIAYAITTLTDRELKDAISAKVIHPGMSRVGLERWRNSYREVTTRSGSDGGSETMLTDASASGTKSLKASPQTTPPVAGDIRSAPDVSAPQVTQTYRRGGLARLLAPVPSSPVPSPSASSPSPSDDEIPAFLDRRPLSPQDRRTFDQLKATWQSHMQPLFRDASAVVRERFFAAIRAETSSQ